MTRSSSSALVAIGLAAIASSSALFLSRAHALPAAVPAPLAPATITKYVGLAAPESVLYDPDGDRYLVSNVNGGPVAHDGNGFISVLSPQGQISALKWIEGGKNGVKLDAPKGLAIANGVLYVADIDVVRTFDAATGAPARDIAVPGSTFLHDLVASPDGRVFLSDAGPPNGGLEANGTEAVYVINRGRARVLAKGKALGRPTGLAWTSGGLVVSPFGASEIYRLDAHGAKRDVTKTPAGGLAGIVAVGDALLVTSWQASSVFRGKLGGAFDVALAQQGTPGDPGYDSKRARLLIPHFDENTVETYGLRP
jgi:DNA-binding beta-propeller fold protein YncE